jgi:hypothetical protein
MAWFLIVVVPRYTSIDLGNGISLLRFFKLLPGPTGGFFLDYSSIVGQCQRWVEYTKKMYSETSNNNYIAPLLISGFQKVE